MAAEQSALETAAAATDAGFPAAQDMKLEKPESEGGNEEASDAPDQSAKRGREEEDGGGAAKKQKADQSAEEKRLEEMKEKEKEKYVEESEVGPVGVGTKVFGSAVEMFDYFYKLLHAWPPNLDINKYEHMVLLDLLKRGHAEPEKKIAGGIRSFQVRFHPKWKSRCFFILREDGVVDDFSFRKCVDSILPLPESMKVHPVNTNGNKNSDGHGKGSGRGGRGGRARGRGGFRR